jgi:hypothetical protein
LPRSKAITVWIGIGLLVASGVYPPWMHANRSYEWIFVRPRGSTQLDIIRLLVEWTIIAAVAAGFYFAPPKFRTRMAKHGWTRVWVRLWSGHAELNARHRPLNWWVEFKDGGSFAEFESLEDAMEFMRNNPDQLE